MIILPKPHKGSETDFYDIISKFDFSSDYTSEATKKLISISEYPIDTLKVPRVGLDDSANTYAKQLYLDILEGNEEYLDDFIADILLNYFRSYQWWEYPEPSFRNCIKDISQEKFLEMIKCFPVFNSTKCFPAISPYNLLHQRSQSGTGYEIFSFDTDWLLRSMEPFNCQSLKNEIIEFKLNKLFYTPNELMKINEKFSSLIIPILKKEHINTSSNPPVFRFGKVLYHPAPQTILSFIHWTKFWSQNGHGVISISEQPLFQLTKQLEYNT